MRNKDKKLVVTLIRFDKDGNYTVDNLVAECKKEARQIVESTIKEIREYWKDELRFLNSMDQEPIKLTKEWVSADNCHLYFGDGKPSVDGWFESRIRFNFFINDSEN